VDEIAFQTRRNLAHRALVDVIPFRREDEAAIRAGARALSAGRDEAVELAPRHLVSAAHYAVGAARRPPHHLAERVIGLLNGAPARAAPALRLAA
jgi:hypothetical protein